MNQREFLLAIQSRVARVSVGASTVRGRGHGGSVSAARRYLRQVKLNKFGANPAEFRAALEKETSGLLKALPKNARHWGIARKLLNIFLRDCLYTTYLEEAYRLRSTQHEYELPLDSITALHLKRAAGRGSLPRWQGVKHVTAATSTTFQAAAKAVAVKKGIARVHLDAVWWSQSRDEDAA